ncbi:YtpR family tRNA-binding protein [Fructilactobacillus fructivorans]|uniref:DUF4479 domain-containing protein n=1 Tax=Fructilactobacillus fructivorans TaxID=1614 RepID=A0AAE6P0E4_9LACO|nr:DUF4479 and tRNA-binding domain-containing protein [Fructilactobacillus fructivorans]QFX92545.1 DUF4479 domain-containing protein [Fructilactobacillus fructivorans]RDV65860.1 tRNA-binding protein [Fructilactobacillus fructivorans]
MMIASYNPTQMGDVLIIVLGEGSDPQSVSESDNVVQIKDKDGKVVGYNIFDASEVLNDLKSKNGQVELSTADVKKLNNKLNQAGFKEKLPFKSDPKFIVGYVEKMEDHPKSDHLHVTQTRVQNDKVLQLVSGSPNMQQGIKVVVAEVGAMMPNGQIIWPGELRGVESDGMICSGRELRIPNAPDRPGALILPDSYQVGEPFDFEKAKNLFNE